TGTKSAGVHPRFHRPSRLSPSRSSTVADAASTCSRSPSIATSKPTGSADQAATTARSSRCGPGALRCLVLTMSTVSHSEVAHRRGRGPQLWMSREPGSERECRILPTAYVDMVSGRHPSPLTVVTTKGGRTVTTDGPFVETKDVLGGFSVI